MLHSRRSKEARALNYRLLDRRYVLLEATLGSRVDLGSMGIMGTVVSRSAVWMAPLAPGEQAATPRATRIPFCQSLHAFISFPGQSVYIIQGLCCPCSTSAFSFSHFHQICPCLDQKFILPLHPPPYIDSAPSSHTFSIVSTVPPQLHSIFYILLIYIFYILNHYCHIFGEEINFCYLSFRNQNISYL